MVLPSLLLLASLVTAGFAAPRAMLTINQVVGDFNNLNAFARNVGVDFNNYPGSAQVGFSFSLRMATQTQKKNMPFFLR